MTSNHYVTSIIVITSIIDYCILEREREREKDNYRDCYYLLGYSNHLSTVMRHWNLPPNGYARPTPWLGKLIP